MVGDHDQADRLWLTVAISGAAGNTCVLLDLQNPEMLVTSEPKRPWPKQVARAVVVHDGEDAELEMLPDGGLQVSRAGLWSLLDPLQVGALVRTSPSDEMNAARVLRTEARHLWKRLQWWSVLPEGLRRECRRRLAAHSAAAGRLCDLLEDLAARSRGDPYQGWSAEPDTAGGPETARQLASAEPAVTVSSTTPRALPPDAREMAAWMLDPAGLGRVYGKHFQPREEQAAMVEEVARSLAKRRPLLVEAGTGVGKTLAYLAPLIQALQSRTQRAVVSTYTRTLQIQLLSQDLPRLASLFPGLKARLLMGRNNYLCRRRRLEFLGTEAPSLADAWTAASLLVWIAATENGMREELADHPLLKHRLSGLFDTAEPCSAAICYEAEDCFVQRARRLARDADLLVVNHSLLMHDLAADNSMLGPYDHLVIDEAHRLPQVALETHAVQCDAARVEVVEQQVGKPDLPGSLAPLLQSLARQLIPLGAPGVALQATLAELTTAFDRCFAAYHRWWQDLGGLAGIDVAAEAHKGHRLRVHDKIQTFAPLRTSTGSLLEAIGRANTLYGRVSEQVESLAELPDTTEECLATLAQVGTLLVTLEQDVRFLTSDESEAWVTWIQPAAKQGVQRLGATRLEAGHLLRDYWQAAGLTPIVTSASLAVGEDFSHMLGELGLTRWQPPTRSVSIPSPFALERQVLTLMPADFPAPDQPGFADELAAILGVLHREVPRKTMVLFTSYRLLQSVAGRLLGGSGQDGAVVATAEEILCQSRSGGHRELQERFRRARQAMLLGTTTFWEGVDFPGTDLEILVVTKLPFQVPNDPWVEARCGLIQATGEDPFTTFMVTDAVLRLRQGCGRLIRRSSDRGVVMMLDTRLHTKSYGTMFLSALPGAPRFFRDADDLVTQIRAFFARVEN